MKSIITIVVPWLLKCWRLPCNNNNNNIITIMSWHSSFLHLIARVPSFSKQIENKRNTKYISVSVSCEPMRMSVTAHIFILSQYDCIRLLLPCYYVAAKSSEFDFNRSGRFVWKWMESTLTFWSGHFHMWGDWMRAERKKSITTEKSTGSTSTKHRW